MGKKSGKNMGEKGTHIYSIFTGALSMLGLSAHSFIHWVFLKHCLVSCAAVSGPHAQTQPRTISAS